MRIKEIIQISSQNTFSKENMSFKAKIYRVLEVDSDRSTFSHYFHIIIMSLIFFNVLFVILGTVDEIEYEYDLLLDQFEYLSVIVFSVEYLLRIWSCTINSKYKHPLIGRIKFALTPMALVDLLAILPFYIPIFIDLDLRVLRVFRLLRMFCLFKLGRYSDSYKLISKVILSRKEHLLVSLALVFSLLIIASSFMYFIEKDAQPQVFSSIPATMWWGIVTLTTVGYGDAYPITMPGKIFSGIIALMGIGLFALPAGILANGFSEELHNKHKQQSICPYFSDMQSCPIHSHLEAAATNNRKDELNDKKKRK